MLRLLLCLTLSFPALACPSYVDSLEAAEAAASKDDFEALHEALAETREGLKCGSILESKSIRARFWLAHAVLFDWRADVKATDDAMFAAWRANPKADSALLPRHLRDRFVKVQAWPTEEATFRLVPATVDGAVVFIDGIATNARRTGGGIESVLQSTSGLHIVQLIESVSAMDASAARVVNLPAMELSQVNIHDDTDPFGSTRDVSAFPTSVVTRSAGGCSARR
jgi:hypothetical protein